MKVVVYGASVTAQKDKTGFFQHLASKTKNYEFIKIPFGASHLHYAGIAMLQKVLDEKPEICVLDWVTPSTKVFPSETVARINHTLLKNRIIPLWVLFPRTDDPECNRECCQQIKSSISNEVFVKNFSDSKYFTKKNTTEILRDTVHTNEFGATLYSNFIIDSLEDLPLEINFENYIKKENFVPKIIPINRMVSSEETISLKIEAESVIDLKIFLYSRIGPKSPILKIEIFDAEGKIIYSTEKNTVDPWCYYEREMLLDLSAIRNIEPGNYTLVIGIFEKNPFDTITTLKPIEESDIIANNDRFLVIHEAAIDTHANVFI